MSMNPRGTSGTPVRVQTNAFRITRLPREDYHHYDGTFLQALYEI